MVVVVMDKDGICRYSSLPLLVIKRYDNLALDSPILGGLGPKTIVIIPKIGFQKVFFSINKLVTFGSFG